MLDKNKILEFFDATKIKYPIHVVGCGAVGSHVIEQLVRMGCTNIHLWDFDTVSSHNITNQMFMHADVGIPKITAMEYMMVDINPDVVYEEHGKGWSGEPLNGYVFLCVDNIELRKQIITTNQMNPNCVAFFDFRMRLTDAQHYAAVRSDMDQVKKLLETMNFTHEEATSATPKSACGVELSVIYTVKTIASLGIANFVSFVLGRPLKTMILADLNMFTVDAFPM